MFSAESALFASIQSQLINSINREKEKERESEIVKDGVKETERT